MKKLRITFFGNGNTMAFDERGKQVADLQESWFSLYVDFLRDKGIDPEGCEFELPHGKATWINKYNNWSMP